MKITVIGGGNLGSAIIKGLEKTNNYNLTLTGRKIEKLSKLGTKPSTHLTINNYEAVKDSDMVILCVQPGQIRDIVTEIEGSLKDSAILVSTAAGFSLQELSSVLSRNQITTVRAMPNTASSIALSMTCISSFDASEEQLEAVTQIFKNIGEVIIIEDEMMQAATVLGASGIAFFLRYIRAVTQGGIQMGFHPNEAQKIAVQTAIGAASLVKNEKKHPESEIDRVTTPKGCTIEGLNEMEHAGLSSAVIKGLMSSYNKLNNIR